MNNCKHEKIHATQTSIECKSCNWNADSLSFLSLYKELQGLRATKERMAPILKAVGNLAQVAEEFETGLQWIKDQRDKTPDAMSTIGGRFSWVLSRTSIGLGVTVLDPQTQEEHDCTDYGSW